MLQRVAVSNKGLFTRAWTRADGFKLKRTRLRVRIWKKFPAVRVVRNWHRFPREDVEPLFQAMLKTRFWTIWPRIQPYPQWRGQNQMIFKISSNLNNSMIPCFSRNKYDGDNVLVQAQLRIAVLGSKCLSSAELWGNDLVPPKVIRDQLFLKKELQSLIYFHDEGILMWNMFFNSVRKDSEQESYCTGIFFHCGKVTALLFVVYTSVLSKTL